MRRTRLYTLVEVTGQTDSVTSDSVELEHIYGYAVQAVWTETVASLTGSIKLQASLDETTWTDVSGSSVSVSGSGSAMWNLSEVMYPFMRAVFTRAGGTYSLTVKVNKKGI